MNSCGLTLETVEVVVAQEVIVDGEELEVEFWQGKAVLARVVVCLDACGIPQNLLVGVERRGVDGIDLGDVLLVTADENFHKNFARVLDTGDTLGSKKKKKIEKLR